MGLGGREAFSRQEQIFKGLDSNVSLVKDGNRCPDWKAPVGKRRCGRGASGVTWREGGERESKPEENNWSLLKENLISIFYAVSTLGRVKKHFLPKGW